MALIIDKQLDNYTRILVWKDDEEFDFYLRETLLYENDTILLNKYKVDRRKKDLIIARFLLQRINPNAQVDYFENGKPFLKNSNAKISISHTKDIVAVILSTKNETAIDIEYINSKVDRLKERFLSQTELNLATSTEIATLFWSAKETLFKIDDVQGIDFIKDLELDFTEKKLRGNIRGQKSFEIEYMIQEGWVMTYIVS